MAQISHWNNSRKLSDAGLKYIRHFQNNYVITPTDKAPGNFSIVCKQLYLSSIADECGITIQNGRVTCSGNATYTLSRFTDPVKLHQQLIKAYGFSCSTPCSRLPLIFATPKLHKPIPKMRFIVAARQSSLKTYEVAVKHILMHYTKHFKNYCQKSQAFSGNTLYVSIKDSHTVARTLNKLHNAKTLFSADFTALYPSLDHNTIKQAIIRIISLCHKNAKSDYLDISNINRIRYCNLQTLGRRIFRKEAIIHMCFELLSNSFMSFANVTLHQVKGVPMGGNASCALADLTLSWYEFQYLHSHPLNKNQRILRYVDDCLAININNFQEISKTIYPAELQLNDTSITDKETNFLDLHIKIKSDGKIDTRIYSKTDPFTFRIIRYFRADCNVPCTMPYGVFSSQILRFLRLTNQTDDFWLRSIAIIKEYIELGFAKQHLFKCFLKTIYQHNTLAHQLILNMSRKAILYKLSQSV